MAYGRYAVDIRPSNLYKTNYQLLLAFQEHIIQVHDYYLDNQLPQHQHWQCVPSSEPYCLVQYLLAEIKNRP